MKKFRLLFLLFSISGVASAQRDSGELVIPVSGFNGLKSFTYRLFATEYITNENEYYLAVTNDTSYLTFTQLERPLHYRLTRSMKDDRQIMVKSTDTFHKIPLDIEFTPEGKVKELTNWKQCRDIIMIGFSNQARLNMISAEDFEEAKVKYNDEGTVRRIVMDDIYYLFNLYGDTFYTGIEYIRLKTIRSPFSGNDYYFQGTLKLDKPAGTKNTVMFESVNKAGPKEKPLLLAEAKEYMEARTPPGEPVTELGAVGLNSEQLYQYNAAQGRMIMVTLSDVVSLSLSSRGNIRKYELWEIKE